MTRGRILWGLLKIEGILECLTGLHIGSGADGIELGGVDSQVIKHPLSYEPYIPATSLRGRLRALLEKSLVMESADRKTALAANYQVDGDGKIFIHACKSFDPSQKLCPLCRLFGSSAYPSALIVRDANLVGDDIKRDALIVYEVKTESSVDRLTSASVARAIERVPASAKFSFEIVYRAETFDGQTDVASGPTDEDKKRFKEDVENIKRALKFLELEGLGAHTTRGYGQVRAVVKNVEWTKAAGDFSLKDEAERAFLRIAEGQS